MDVAARSSQWQVIRSACLELAAGHAARTPCSATRWVAGIALLLAATVPGRCAAGVVTQTITTTYQYNADGAPTAMTTQVGSQPATTTYLTWDDFTANANAPNSGTVSAADGNLLGVGPTPGTSGLTTQFGYDVRDRLTACTAGQSAVSYAYHPASLMASSTLASGDALQFYYDNTATPLMVNTRQPSADLVSSFLGPVRYLSDGTEQVLFTPRKNTAGVYDASTQTLTPYSYEPYGAPRSPSAAASGLSSDGTSYDLAQNPFQYAGEYQDPTCNAYYLRARWYLPAQQTFLSRDPADGLHRYSYTAGNPVGRIDPSGLKYTGEDFSRDIEKAVGKLTPGLWAYIEPVLPVWGQALGGIELLGDLPSFWHHPTTKGMITFGFLAASIVSEVGGETRPFERLFATPTRAFQARIGIELGLGASQTAAQSERPGGRVDVSAVIQGVELTMSNIFWVRLAGGVGYRPFNMSSDDVADTLSPQFHQPGGDRTILVYRVRRPLAGARFSYTSPLLERLQSGWYHEETFAITKDWAIFNELDEQTDEVAAGKDRVPWRVVRQRLRDIASEEAAAGEPATEFAFAGAVDRNSSNAGILRGSPLGYLTANRRMNFPLPAIDEEGVAEQPGSGFGRGAQRHAAAIRRGLGL